MRRTLLHVVLTMAVLLIPAGTNATAGTTRPCASIKLAPRFVSVAEYHHRAERLIRCLSTRYGTSVSTAHYVGHRESGANLFPRAVSPNGCCRGVFQHHRAYWSGRAERWLEWGWFKNAPGKVSVFNPTANIIVTIRMAASGGWGPWGMG